MWNIFKHKTVEAPKNEKPEIAVENLEAEKLEDSEPMDVRLEVLASYLEECKKNGIEITPEMAEKEINEKLGLNISELLDQEIEDSEVKKISRNTVAEIEEMMTQKAADKGTVLKYLREKIFKSNFAKAAFVTAILFLKFNPGHAATDNVKDKDQKKTEYQKPVNHDGGDDHDKTYDSTKDFKDTEKKITIKAGSFFDTDKADLKNQSELGDKFNTFFSSINSANFEKMMSHNWIFTSSSDERKTSNWEGSNKNLSDARFSSFAKMFEEAKTNHTFVGLSADQVKQILDKPVLSVQPVNGETHITDLVNPKTNKNFTAKEASTLSSADREKLLDKCRYANFEVESSMFEIGTFGQFILLVDDSPSMKISKANMANELRYVNKDMPVKVGFFSSDLSDIEQLGSSQAAADEVLKAPSNGSGAERALSSSIQYLEKISADDVSSKTMYVATDEGLQDMNKILQLTELAEKTNTAVTFLMFYENGSKFIKLSANDLLDKVKKTTESNSVTQQESLNKNILSYEKQINGLIKDVSAKLTSGDFSASNIYDALEKDGIKGGVEQIKKALADTDFRNLKNFEKTYLGGKLVTAKLNLMSDKILLTYMHLPLEQQIAKSEKWAKDFGDKLQFNKIANLTTFEDAKGNKVEIPII